MVNGETNVNLFTSGATFANSAAGPHTVTASGLTIGGADASNYVLSSTTATTSATINALPIAGDITGGNEVCMQSTLQLTENANGVETLQFIWHSSDENVATVDNFGEVTPIAPGVTQISYTVTDNSTTNCVATSNDFAVTVNALPTPIAGTYRPVCLNSTDITLGGTPSGGVWTGTGVSGTQPNYVFQPSFGTQTLTYTYTDGNSCVNHDHTTIISGEAPITTVSNVTICQNTNTVDVPVKVNSFNNVGAISLTLRYDETKLGLATLASSHPALWSDIQVNTATPGEIRIVGQGDGITLAGNPTLFTFTFTKGSAITSGSLDFLEDIQGTNCEYAPDIAPDYTPFCDMPTATYYIGGGVIVNNISENSITESHTICLGGTPSLLNGTTVTEEHGGVITYQWEISTTSESLGFDNILVDGTSHDYQPTAPGVSTWYRRLTTSVLNGVTCNYYTNAVKVTVVPDPSWTAYTFPTTSLCNGGSVTFSAGINDGLGGTVTWIRSDDATPGVGTEVTVTSPNSPGVGTWYYRPHFAPLGEGCNLSDGNQTTVTVVADPSWTNYSFPTPPSLCGGGSVTFNVDIANGLGGDITWLRSETSGGVGTLVVSGDQPGVGTWYYRPHYTPTGEGCDLADGTETTITVVADPSWTAYTFPTTSLCGGGSVTFSAAINDGLGGTVTWIRSDNVTPGAGTEVLVSSPNSPGVGTWYYRPHYTPLGEGCNLTDGTQTAVTVVTDPSWTNYSFPTPSTLCGGGSVTFSVDVTNGLGGDITWLRSLTSGGAGTLVVSGDQPGVGTWYYRPHYTPTGEGCDLADGTETTITVVADPSWTAYTFPTTSLCGGGSVTFSVDIAAGLGGGITWIRSDNVTPGVGTEVLVSSPDSPGLGTWYYRPQYTPTGEGCNLADGDQTTVTVVADPSWTNYSFPTPTTLCNGGSVNFSVEITNGLGGVITWLRSETSGGVGTEVVTGDQPGVGTWYYRPHYAPTGEGCDLADGTEKVVTVSVDPSWLTNTVDQSTGCVTDNAVTFSATVTGGLGGDITWLRSTTSGGVITTLVTSPDSPGAGTWYYRPHYTPTGEGCNLSDGAETAITFNQLQKISGVFTYYNTANTLLTGADITVELYKKSDLAHLTLLGSDVTDANGYYEFTGLCPDFDYDIVAASTHTTVGSVNSADAGQANAYGANPYIIEKVRFHAGDVGTSSVASDLTINGTDAQRIQKNFVNRTPFDNAWTFWASEAGNTIQSATTTESYSSVRLAIGVDKTANMYGLCTGDFNRSFNPSLGKTRSTTLDLVYANNNQMSKNEEFELPVRMVNPNSVGAISLIFNFPSDLVEVQDVVVNGAEGQLDWAVDGNELLIGWNSQTPLDLGVGAKLLTLRLKTTNAFTNESSIMFALAGNPLNELADGQFEVINDAKISIDVINSTLGITEQASSKAITLSNYPNPFNNNTTINYTLPFDGKVTLEIRDIFGKTVNFLVSEMQTNGDYSVKVDASNFTPGVYMATLKLSGKTEDLVRTIKIINK